jgi:hypothetical protein
MTDLPIAIPKVKETLMREYEARRCHICDCRYPSFGFGPPLTRGTVLWACRIHRAEVEAVLRSGEGR